MAYKPSDRRQSADEKADLDIRPIMNLMVCLIPLLLAGAQFIKNTQLEVNLPPGKSASSSDSEPPADEDKKKLNLGLTVAITAKGFYISASNVTIYGPKTPEEPTVPKTADGEYDYLGLRNRLKDLRKEIDNSGKNFADKDKIKLTASKDIAYEIYIKVQDAVSAEIIDKKPVEIFHLVQIGQVI
jgi:biopolymer transport protein ExbD